MKKLAYLSVAAASAIAIASPAAAQDVTGTVNITGTVTPKCLVVPANSDDFTANVDLGELAQDDGTLEATGTLEARFLSSGGTALEARVVCTSAAPTISVDATEITTPTAVVAGYTNRIDYTAHVFVDTTSTSDIEFTNDSLDSPLAATLIGGRLANNGGGNISITATDFQTANADDLLVAATDYTGQIVVVIAPGA